MINGHIYQLLLHISDQNITHTESNHTLNIIEQALTRCHGMQLNVMVQRAVQPC